MKTYCYSLNEESYYGQCNSREEALKEALEENLHRPEHKRVSQVFTAELVECDFRQFVDEEQIFDLIRDKADEFAGEATIGFIEANEEQREKLLDLIDHWATETNNQPGFHGIIDIQKHMVEKP